MKKIFRCKNCTMMSTRPRLTFDTYGVCSACQWMKKKQKIDWAKKEKDLKKILKKHKRSNKDFFDCIVPVSGGKDGSYIAYNLKKKYNMNPLCLTINPALQTNIGKKNLENFVRSGFNLISVSIDYHSLQIINKIGFQQIGFPYYGWLLAIHSAVFRMASMMNINLIIYAEDGEREYGGASQTVKNPIFSIDYQKKIYLEGHTKKIINIAKKNVNFNPIFFEYPDIPKKKEKEIELIHWSSFDNWDPYKNYLIAKKYCGLIASDSSNEGTFTNFAQTDQALVALHTYCMFLKFGFGRACADAAIEVRRGAMDRDQALNLVKLYDGQYPQEYLKDYLNYYKMSLKEFDKTLDKFANKNLLNKNQKTKQWKLKEFIY